LIPGIPPGSIDFALHYIILFLKESKTMDQKSLVLVKPDGVRKHLIGEIIARFERRGLKICALKMLVMTKDQAKYHYAEHVDKPFFPELEAFITGGPLVAMIVEGPNAIKAIRTMMGVTDPIESTPGSIRGDFALDKGENVIHGSDSPEAAEREIKNFFKPEEIY
jgi:nucleoside-diphosphate kinase